jgi:hypothetical protein
VRVVSEDVGRVQGWGQMSVKRQREGHLLPIC